MSSLGRIFSLGLSLGGEEVDIDVYVVVEVDVGVVTIVGIVVVDVVVVTVDVVDVSVVVVVDVVVVTVVDVVIDVVEGFLFIDAFGGERCACCLFDAVVSNEIVDASKYVATETCPAFFVVPAVLIAIVVAVAVDDDNAGAPLMSVDSFVAVVENIGYKLLNKDEERREKPCGGTGCGGMGGGETRDIKRH